MHRAAYTWLAQHAHAEFVQALDLGGRDVNGAARGMDVRALWPAATWTVVDVLPGEDVTDVADAATWLPAQPYGLVLCTEVCEHTPLWPAVLVAARRAGGTLLLTAAGPRRRPHGATGGPLPGGEFYGGIDPDLLREVLVRLYDDVTVDVARKGMDLRAVAR